MTPYTPTNTTPDQQSTNTTDNQLSTYTQQDCRSACLQRAIWTNCHCLDLESKLPFEDLDGSLLCGFLSRSDMKIFLQLNKYNKTACIRNATQLISQKCNFLHKLINDLACVEDVKEKHILQPDCNCPAPCYRYDYEVSVTQTPWPEAGFEMNAAYVTLVLQNKSWNYTFTRSQTGNQNCGGNISGDNQDTQQGSGNTNNSNLNRMESQTLRSVLVTFSLHASFPQKSAEFCIQVIKMFMFINREAREIIRLVVSVCPSVCLSTDALTSEPCDL